MNALRIRILFFILLVCWMFPAFALTFALPKNGDNIVGRVQWTQVLPGDTFSFIGRRYDLGYYQLVEANPGVDPMHPPVGTIIVVPTRFILPSVSRKGIVVNLAELRIYYFPEQGDRVMTYPVGIGRSGWDTPLGPSQVVEKRLNPTWYVPDSIRKARAEEGVTLPKQVLPGPDNPLGGYALRLAQQTYLIHGTNDFRGVGRRSSSGCIRMFPEDIEALFMRTKVGTTIMIINDPYKIGISKNKFYLESHVPLQDQQDNDAELNMNLLKKTIHSAEKKYSISIDTEQASSIAELQNGIPQLLTVIK